LSRADLIGPQISSSLSLRAEGLSVVEGSRIYYTQIMRYKLLFFLIIILAIFLRFYRLPEMAPFDFDQEYAANFAYSVLKTFPVQLIGQGLSVEGLFMGPFYFYLLVPFFALSNLHPLGGAVASSIFGIVIVFAYFWAGKQIFGTKAGLIAAFIRAILFNELLHDWSAAPAYSSELLVLTVWYIFYKYWQGETKLSPLLGLIFGLFTSIHPILFPLYIIFLILLLIKRKLPGFKITVLSFFAFLLPQIPLLIFESLRNFYEVKILLAFGGSGRGLQYPSLYFKFNMAEIQRILNLQIIPPETFTVVFLGILVVLAFKKVAFFRNNFHASMLILTYFVFIIYYALFPKKVPEYYFLTLTTLAILYTGALLNLLAKKKIFIALLAVLLANIFWGNFQAIMGRWENGSLMNLSHKDAIVKEILKNQPKNEEFFVSYIKYYGWNSGFDYLFKLYGQVPQTREAKPPVYSIVIPRFLVSEADMDFTSGNIGLILPK